MDRTTKTIFSCLLVSLVTLIGSERALACSCFERETPAKTYRKVSSVFVGTISGLAATGSRFSDLRATFVPDEILKGNRSDHINVNTSSQGTACGYPFENGGTYLVYASRDQETNELETSICTRTRLLSFGSVDDEIEVLRSLSKKRFEPRLYGRVEEIVRGIYLGDRKPNKPFPGIRVIARGASNVYSTKSDERGLFRFVGISPGRYRLDLDLPDSHKIGDDSWGFVEKQKQNLSFTVTTTDAPDLITIETRVNGRIQGRVRDSSGKPAKKGVRITLVTRGSADKPVDQIQYIGTDTDNQGFYEFDGIPEGEYLLGLNLDLSQPYKDNPFPKIFFPGVSKPGDATPVKMGYGQKLGGFDLTLPSALRLIRVRGRVLNEDGSAVVGLQVYVSNQARHDFEDFVWLKTDSNGNFEATCLENVTYDFKLYDGTRYDQPLAARTITVNEQDRGPVEFTIRK